jgi:hypothetical protein
MVQWDGMYDPFPHTRCSFVIGPGHAEVMRRFGYQIPTEVTGWTMCKLIPFEPVKEVRTILFGPIHPNSNGYLSDLDGGFNQDTLRRLYEYSKASGARLVVRHVRALEKNLIPRLPGVEYIQASPDGSIVEIDNADLVVGHQTFGYLAVARGKPVLMMGEYAPPRSGGSDADLRFVKSWEKYADYLMYPLDVLSGPATVENTADLITQATRRNTKVTAWRDKFIGEQFYSDDFVAKLESYL